MLVTSPLKSVTAFAGSAFAACLRVVFQFRSPQFGVGVPAGSSSASHSLSRLRPASVVLASPLPHGVRSHSGCLSVHTPFRPTRALRAGVLRRAISSWGRSAATPVLGPTIACRQSEGTVVSVIASSKAVALHEQRPNPSTRTSLFVNSGC
jgi:hypothetical protein